jgi:hypothetical protein
MCPGKLGRHAYLRLRFSGHSRNAAPLINSSLVGRNGLMNGSFEIFGGKSEVVVTMPLETFSSPLIYTKQRTNIIIGDKTNERSTNCAKGLSRLLAQSKEFANLNQQLEQRVANQVDTAQIALDELMLSLTTMQLMSPLPPPTSL